MKTMKQVLSVATTVLVAALTMTGCGKNDSGNNNAAVPYPGAYGQGYGACGGCITGGPMQPFTASASDSLGELIQLQFQTSGSSINQQYDSSVPVQIIAVGQLNIQGNSGQQCAVPPGIYQLQATSPGKMTDGNIPVMNFTATGPNQVLMQVRIHFLPAGKMQVNGIMAGVQAQNNPCQLVMY
jgi:hypothetical protein